MLSWPCVVSYRSRLRELVSSHLTSALVLYDYLLTFDRELDLIWRRKWTGPSVLFVVNRYSALMLSLISALWLFVQEVWKTSRLSLIRVHVLINFLRALVTGVRFCRQWASRSGHLMVIVNSCATLHRLGQLSGISLLVAFARLLF